MKLSPFPVRDDVLDLAQKRVLSTRWASWFLDLFNAVNSRVDVVASARLTAQTTAVALTALQTREALPEGLYRVSAYVVPTQGNARSAGADVTIQWVSAGQTFSRAITDVFASTLIPPGGYSGQTMFRIDAGSVVRFSTTHASGTFPSPSFIFNLDVVLERLL